MGIEQDWYHFRELALKQIAADFLDDHGIAYVDDGKPTGAATETE